MPLLDKKAFVRTKPPKDLSPNEELFYCKLTHEVFREYELFFERVILCNSLVWTCSLTGRSNMTFAEALESEKIARQSLRNFSLALRKPVLYLASLTERGRLNDMCDDVFMYVKDRYFVGEEVEVAVNGTKKSCEVTQVILPERPQRTPVKSETSRLRKIKDITPLKIKYEVVSYDTGKTVVVKSESISRLKGSYTKPKNKLFIKHHTHPSEGIWKVKESTAGKLQLDEFQFSEAFAGLPPSYAASPNKRKLPTSNTPDKNDKLTGRRSVSDSGKRTVQGKLNFKKETAEDRQILEKHALSEKQRIAAEKMRQKERENVRKRLEEDKERQKQEKLKEREKKREEKKIIAEYLNSWKKPRDDLECDDLKDLPVSTPIECGIPNSCFGDAIMILEFLNTFGNQIQIKDSFPQGFTFDHLERALVETDIQGIFNDLLQLFLTSLFQLQEADDDNFGEGDENGLRALEEGTSLTIDKAMALAATVSAWPQKYHGTILRNIPLDSFSVTEILRLHILSSGARPRVNYQGVTGPSEDPGLYFKMEETQLLKTLATTSVFQLSCEDRVKILTVLIHQLLSSGVVRYAVDENAEKTRPLRHQLKQLQWAQSRKQKEQSLSKKRVPQKEERAEGDAEEGSEELTAIPDDEEKENSDNLSPEERAKLEEKQAKDTAKQKAEFLRKEREIQAQLRKLQSSFNVTPIGRDRAYRRYWVFQSVAGVFLEDDDPFKGECLPKQTVQIQSPNPALNRSEVSTSNIKKYMHHLGETKNGSSDKENEILRDLAIVQNDIASPLKSRKLSDLNPRVDFKKAMLESSLHEEQTCLQCKNKVGDMQDNLTWYCPHSKGAFFPLDQCNANMETCPVHNIYAPRTKWSFFYKEEELDALIASLNSRGFRERSLKEALVNEAERIKEMMLKSPYNVFNRTLPTTSLPEVRKSQRHQPSHSSTYANMLPQQALDLTLRDMVLELEHRIFVGGLGSLKVSNRESWKSALDQGTYDMQCDSLLWGRANTVSLNSVKEDSDCNTKTSHSSVIDQVVKDLASAMLQVSQGIEAKYLYPPLGETDAFKHTKQKALNDIVAWESQQKKRDGTPCPKIPISPLEKWQESLHECTSTSQLFLHLGTLERSVAWSRSVLKAHCRICRRRGDAENMLLCDGCNRGHHLYCLKPPLEIIPEDDWFCLSCKPIEKTRSPQKKQKAESDSDVDAASSENESEESEEDEDNDESEMADQTYVEETCEICGDVGTLICCDKCPLMFHPECIDLKRIPRGEWLCPKCTKKATAVKKARKHPSSGSYGTRSQSLTTNVKRSKPSIKTSIRLGGTKRAYEETSDSEWAPMSKRACRERGHSTNNTEKDENPFKKVYRDSALNTARRRSKSGIGGDMLDYKACIDLLVELMHHPSSWPFLVPVNKKDAPGYHLIIKRPMDFGTIRSKLNYMSYKNNEDFVRDLYLVLQNCEWFNPKSSLEFKAAQVLYKEVKRLLGEYQLCNPFTTNYKLHNVNES